MKSKLLTTLAAALSLHFASCAAGPNTQAGALTGAALGGVAGAIIGNNVGDGDAGTGALIGAAVGGAAGADVIEQWELKNAWVKSVKYGELSYESDDMVNIDMTLRYDFAVKTK